MNKIQPTKKIPKGSVLAVVKRQRELYKETGSYLNENITFEPSLRLNGNQDEILKSVLVLCGMS